MKRYVFLESFVNSSSFARRLPDFATGTSGRVAMAQSDPTHHRTTLHYLYPLIAPRHLHPIYRTQVQPLPDRTIRAQALADGRGLVPRRREATWIPLDTAIFTSLQYRSHLRHHQSQMRSSDHQSTLNEKDDPTYILRKLCQPDHALPPWQWTK